MSGWPDRSLVDRLGVGHPILLAPMAGAGGLDLAIAIARAGGLAALPCGMATPEQIEREIISFRAATAAPLNLNFFCHELDEQVDDSAWRAALAPYYAKFRVEAGEAPALRRPFSAVWADLVEQLRPEVISFHFGLPAPELLDRARATGAVVLGNATNIAEGRWLAARGADAIIAQGWEAGGHSGWFLGDRPSPLSLVTLVPQLVDSLDVPVIAAGGIMDGRGIAAALTLGASAVQMGTAFLATPECLAGQLYRVALQSERTQRSIVTNLISGRTARVLPNKLIEELGPLNVAVPAYPHASTALAPLRRAAEAQGLDDFTPMLAGQGAPLIRAEPARTLFEGWAREALALLPLRS